MNKKILSIIILVFLILVGGIVFWQSSKQNISHSSVTEKDGSDSCGLSSCTETDKTEKNLVEVFYLPHPPVDPIREKIKSILQKFPEYKLKEYDFTNNNNEQKIEDYNLTGHIPVAVFIGGIDNFLVDGQKITFKNFPKDDAFVPSLEGSWSYGDLEKVLADPNKYKND